MKPGRVCAEGIVYSILVCATWMAARKHNIYCILYIFLKLISITKYVLLIIKPDVLKFSVEMGDMCSLGFQILKFLVTLP